MIVQARSVRKWGSPPFNIAAIHGGPGAPGSIAPVALELSSDHGVLEPFQTRDSIDSQVEQLREQLESDADFPAVLVGHSWGAWLAWVLAARHPDMVSKLILVGSGPFEAHYAEQIMPVRMSRLPPESRPEVSALVRDLEDPGAGRHKRAMIARLSELMFKADHFDALRLDLGIPDCGLGYLPDVYAKVWWEGKELRRSGRLLAMAKDIRCPVIAIHGDYDPHPSEGVEKPLRAALRDFRFILLEKCGHEPWIELHARAEFFSVLRREVSGL